jgi:1-acyl-sn-glycerol-3-phosphate acyltransferase
MTRSFGKLPFIAVSPCGFLLQPSYVPVVPAASLPRIGARVPRTGGAISSALGHWTLRLLRWRVEGDIPDVAKMVLIVAPHSSNWDFVVGVAAKVAMRLRVRYLGKDTLFRFPLGIVMRYLGGIPVDRSTANDVVVSVVSEFQRRDQMLLAIAPEGTRKPVTRWRTGFYHIARGARVPILPVALDWQTRTIRIGELFSPSGDLEVDLQVLRSRVGGSRR